MPLSFSTITTGVSRPPALSSASKLTPPVIAPSPTTATTRASGCSSAGEPELRAQAHRLLDADRVARGGRGVAGAHDVVRRLLARAERRQPAVLADARQLVAAAGQHLVRIGLVADVPEDLVARRVEHAVQRDRQLAGAEVRAEVAADLADRVDDVLAHLLRELLELVLVELLEVVRAVDAVEQDARCRSSVVIGTHHALRLNMKSAIGSRSEGSPASSAAPRSSAAARPAVRLAPPARAPARGRRRSRRCACRGARRLPAALPISASEPVTSRMSSTIWNSTPSSAREALERSSRAARARPAAAGATATLARDQACRS